MSTLRDDCFVNDGSLMGFADALDILLERAHAVVAHETVPLRDALGRVLAQDIKAPRDLPPHDNSAVDGYAVRYSDLNKDGDTQLPVGGRIAAGHPLGRALGDGEAAQIFTGAPVPEGADTIFMNEDVSVDGDRVTLPAGIKQGANRRLKGEDVAEGEIVLKAGLRLRAQDIGMAASFGCASVDVYTRLRVAVFSTGDEIQDPIEGEARAGAIWDVNRYAVQALLKGLGCEVTDLGILPDEIGVIRSALHDAAPGHDLILTSGGVSQGEEDHVGSVVESLGSLHFWRLAIKPGRPIALGQVMDTAFVGLPGNPVAAMVTFMRIARPLILKLSGQSAAEPHIFKVAAAFNMTKKPGRREWLRARLETDADGEMTVHKYPSQGSGILNSMVASDGLVELSEDLAQVAEGDLVDFIPFSEMT